MYIFKKITIQDTRKTIWGQNKCIVLLGNIIGLGEKKIVVENFRKQNKHSIRINSMGGLFYGGLLYS